MEKCKQSIAILGRFSQFLSPLIDSLHKRPLWKRGPSNAWVILCSYADEHTEYNTLIKMSLKYGCSQWSSKISEIEPTVFNNLFAIILAGTTTFNKSQITSHDGGRVVLLCHWHLTEDRLFALTFWYRQFVEGFWDLERCLHAHIKYVRQPQRRVASCWKKPLVFIATVEITSQQHSLIMNNATQIQSFKAFGKETDEYGMSLSFEGTVQQAVGKWNDRFSSASSLVGFIDV